MIDPDAKVGLFTRIRDWLTYKPWTDDEIAEQVARAVANTSYATNWGRPVTGEQIVGPARWMGGYWTDEEDSPC